MRKRFVSMLLAASMALASPTIAFSEDSEQSVLTENIISRLIYAESTDNPNAYNPRTGATGYMQITPIVLEEWNMLNPSRKYTMDEMYDITKNLEVGKWYLARLENHYLPFYNLEPSLENIIVAWNWGPNNLRRLGDALENFSDLPVESRDLIEKVRGF